MNMTALKEINTGHVLFNVDRYGVATVTLNNPEKHNAFDDKIIAQLTVIFMEIAERDDINVMILASTGKSFSAGADLGWMKRMASYSYEENLSDANCDIVIASNKASFCLSEVKLGLIPATISPYVVNAIGQKACRRYFQTAERFFAEKAQQLGLVDEIVNLEELENTVNNMVITVLSNGPQAVRHAKQLALDVAYQDINLELLSLTSERIASIRVSDEGQEGLTAFFEKRPANWIKEPTSEG
jgi:methylglutaconyl-CoA hydratase